jgi:hypothetical protein
MDWVSSGFPIPLRAFSSGLGYRTRLAYQATFSNAGTLPTDNTTVAENVAIEASTFTGTSINLQSVYVKITHP